jgi:hypothetical protein
METYPRNSPSTPPAKNQHQASSEKEKSEKPIKELLYLRTKNSLTIDQILEFVLCPMIRTRQCKQCSAKQAKLMTPYYKTSIARNTKFIKLEVPYSPKLKNL